MCLLNSGIFCLNYRDRYVRVCETLGGHQGAQSKRNKSDSQQLIFHGCVHNHADITGEKSNKYVDS